jgi:hypothetical protein
LFASAVLQACASPTPQLDSRFGDAVRAAKLQQTLNPDAGRQVSAVDGIEGTPARETMERYQDSFKAPPPTFEIIFGSGVSAGGR